ncbi:hypothetical protein [Desulfosporosinus sp. OT]|uniref:hypothetical protein n=1 Tax=Desulfosporosinus sp. OT TaxID=913865 RepID=UPI000223A279|nr:hypothetical protein [Desulfosporosinus sp. OT]EGW40749.1 hypothetical protein DOT_1373 [Desulfosporosinus sp. OT]
MDFLKKILSRNNTTEEIDINPEQDITLSNDYQEDTPKNFQPALTSVNLMSRFFRTQKLSHSEPPETLHENEAWAPETEFVGLFRKHRFNAKEYPSSSSDPQ